jgi:hypothetical protein
VEGDIRKRRRRRRRRKTGNVTSKDDKKSESVRAGKRRRNAARLGRSKMRQNYSGEKKESLMKALSLLEYHVMKEDTCNY